MYEYKFTLERVVDGDTIDGAIDLGFGITINRRVRLLGINAPETRTKDLQEKQAGLKAKRFLTRWLTTDNANIVIQTKKDASGKYGRLLAEIYMDGIHVQQRLLEMGLATPYDGGKR